MNWGGHADEGVEKKGIATSMQATQLGQNNRFGGGGVAPLGTVQVSETRPSNKGRPAPQKTGGWHLTQPMR